MDTFKLQFNYIFSSSQFQGIKKTSTEKINKKKS